MDYKKICKRRSMKKTIILILAMILIVPIVLTVNSENREDYYLDPATNYYIADSIETSGTEYSINGTEILHGANLTSRGWSYSGELPMTYQDTKTTTGTLAINGTRDISINTDAFVDLYNNASFTGKCEVDIYIASGYQASTFVGVQFFDYTDDNKVYVAWYPSINPTYWYCNDGCSNDTYIVTFDTWHSIVFNVTGSNTETHIDDVLLDTRASQGFGKLRLTVQIGDAEVYYDDIACYSENERPQEFISDTTNPTIIELSINNSLPKYDNDALVSALLNDNIELDWWRIAHNQSGTMTNQTINDISGSSYNATYIFSDAITKHNVIAYQFWTNDTSNNAETSAIYTFTVVNTPPQQHTSIFPVINGVSTFNNDPLDLNLTFPSDVDGDVITIYFYINGTLNATSTSNVSIDIGDGYYQWNVSLYDDEDYNVYVPYTENDFKIDRTFPILSVTSPTVTTYNTNITVNVTCSDLNPFILNYTIFNSTNDIVKSAQDTTPVGNLLKIVEIFDITDVADGNYIANFSCSDSHTRNEIDDYYITYQANGIMYDTAEGNRIKIVQVGQPATPSTSKKIDRYEFHFGASKNIEERTYKIISTWHDIIVVEDSNYDAHLVVLNGAKGNWIDFESSDSQIISIERFNPRHVEVTVWATDFNFKSIGGLNVATDSVAFAIQREVSEIVEEDAVLNAVLLLGGFGLMIIFVVILFSNLIDAIRTGKIK